MKRFFNFLGGVTLIALSTISYTFAYTQEQQEAYQWAYKNKITTQPNIQSAKLNGVVTRQALSKMIVNYLENVAEVKGSHLNSCTFIDENKITNDLKYYTKKVCAYKIMGTNKSNFKPTQKVNRAQLGTVLSRILWGNEYNAEGKGYYVFHLNALKQKGVMNNIKNPKDYVTRGDVLIMLKRMSESFGSNIYLNGNPIPAYNTTIKQTNNTNDSANNSGNYENEYISDLYSNSNVIYTGKNGTKYYYDYKFLNLLKNAAEKKGESDLANYLKIEAEYFKNGLDQLANLDDEELLKAMGIDTNDIDPDNMTNKQKQELIKKFKTGFSKIIKENKDRNNETLKSLEKITKNIKSDKFGLKEKYKKTKTFMDASNTFLDYYSESMFTLIEIALANDDATSEEGATQAFGIIGVALAYQGEAEEYQKYVEEWGVNTLKILGIN